MTMDAESIHLSIQDIRHEIDKLTLAIYGDRKTPPNGGGIYGELRRMRDEAKSNNADRHIALAEIEKRMAGLEEKIERRMAGIEEQIDKLDRRVRPLWWDYAIVAGAAAILAMLILQVLTISGHVG